MKKSDKHLRQLADKLIKGFTTKTLTDEDAIDIISKLEEEDVEKLNEILLEKYHKNLN